MERKVKSNPFDLFYSISSAIFFIISKSLSCLDLGSFSMISSTVFLSPSDLFSFSVVVQNLCYNHLLFPLYKIPAHKKHKKKAKPTLDT